MIGTTDDFFDNDLFKQQCEELAAEAELRHYDYEHGLISFEEYELEHYSLVAKYKALRHYLIASHDEKERQKRL